jgi:hypothetical protein
MMVLPMLPATPGIFLVSDNSVIREETGGEGCYRMRTTRPMQCHLERHCCRQEDNCLYRRIRPHKLTKGDLLCCTGGHTKLYPHPPLLHCSVVQESLQPRFYDLTLIISLSKHHVSQLSPIAPCPQWCVAATHESRTILVPLLLHSSMGPL